MARARPNFFIVGAPKCGTTALSEYLASHPQVFLSPVKEPRYFAEELRELPRSEPYGRDLAAYLELFSSCGPGHSAIGEASVRYLNSPTAIPNIRRFDPQARLVVMVRNPVEMARSEHAELLRSHEEDVRDFGKAWNLQALRRTGESIPGACRWPPFLQYADTCKVGRQLERLYGVFPREQVEVVVFEDLVSDTRSVYQRVLGFLGLEPDARTHFPRVNPRRSVRRPRLSRLSRRLLYLDPVVALKRKLGLPRRQLVRIPERFYLAQAASEPIAADLHAELVETFRDDVRLLQELLGRDLSAWLRIPERAGPG